MAKKIYFYSLLVKTNSPNMENLQEMFFQKNINDKINRLYFGPQLNIAKEVSDIFKTWSLKNGKEISIIAIPNGPIYDPEFGSHDLFNEIVPKNVSESLKKGLKKDVLWENISKVLNNYDLALENIKKATLELYNNLLKEGDECLVLLAFPFIEIAFEAFSVDKNFFLFRQYQGFSFEIDAGKNKIEIL